MNFLSHGGYPMPIYLGYYYETPNDDETRLLKGLPYTNNSPQKCKGYLYFGFTYA